MLKFINSLSNNTDNKVNYTIILSFLYLVFVLIRFTISLIFQEPVLFGDELLFKSMAYDFFNTGNFFKELKNLNLPAIPSVMYSLIISLSFLFNENFYIVIKLINSLMINLSIFPVFLVFKEFISIKKALFFSAAISLLPSINYSNFVMAENLYYPLFIFLFYFIYKIFTTQSMKYNLYTGIFLCILYLTKPHALALIAAIFVSCFFIIIYLIFIQKNFEKIKKIIISLAVVSIVFLTFFLILKLLLKNNISLKLGPYSSVVREAVKIDNIFSYKFLLMLVSHISSILFLYCIPIVLSFFILIQSVKKKYYDQFVFLILGLTSFVLIFLMAVKNTADISYFDNFTRLYGRYYFVVYPFFIISFVSFADKFFHTGIYKIILISVFVFSVCTNIFIFFPQYVSGSLNNFFLHDNIDLTWTLYPKEFIAFLFISNILLVLFYSFTKTENKIMLYMLFFIFMSLISNFSQILYFSRYNNVTASELQKLRNFVYYNIKDKKSSVAVVEHGFFNANSLAFWSIYNLKIFKYPNDVLISKSILPENVDSLVLLNSYQVDPAIRGKKIKRGNVSIILFKENVVSSFKGIYPDNFTEKIFSFESEIPHKKMIINLHDIQFIIPCLLKVVMENKTDNITITNEIKRIELPFSRKYQFFLDKSFIPKNSGISIDTRDMGLYIKSIELEY